MPNDNQDESARNDNSEAFADSKRHDSQPSKQPRVFNWLAATIGALVAIAGLVAEFPSWQTAVLTFIGVVAAATVIALLALFLERLRYSRVFVVVVQVFFGVVTAAVLYCIVGITPAVLKGLNFALMPDPIKTDVGVDFILHDDPHWELTRRNDSTPIVLRALTSLDFRSQTIQLPTLIVQVTNRSRLPVALGNLKLRFDAVTTPLEIVVELNSTADASDVANELRTLRDFSESSISIEGMNVVVQVAAPDTESEELKSRISKLLSDRAVSIYIDAVGWLHGEWQASDTAHLKLEPAKRSYDVPMMETVEPGASVAYDLLLVARGPFRGTGAISVSADGEVVYESPIEIDLMGPVSTSR